jgi:uncharacterized protein involved in exopolysaccharide biosynthesis
MQIQTWNEEQGIDFRAMYRRVAQRPLWLLASIVIVTLPCVLAAFLLTPVYRATTVLVPAETGRGGGIFGSALGELGGLASLAGIEMGGGASETEEALAVLRSRSFTEGFIKDLGLLPKLFPDKWDAAAGTWKKDIGQPPTLAHAYKRFHKRIRSVMEDKKTGLINVDIRFTDREQAAQWANVMVDRLNEEMRRRAIEKADASLRYLEQEFQTSSNVATRQAIGRLIEAQVNQRMLANVTREYAFRVVDRALPAEADDPASPNKLALLIAGPVAGFTIGVVLILIAAALREEQPAQR